MENPNQYKNRQKTDKNLQRLCPGSKTETRSRCPRKSTNARVSWLLTFASKARVNRKADAGNDNDNNNNDNDDYHSDNNNDNDDDNNDDNNDNNDKADGHNDGDNDSHEFL